MKSLSKIWILFTILFSVLFVMHLFLMLQPDIVPPPFEFIPLQSSVSVLMKSPEGKMETMNEMRPFNEFGERFNHFVNNDFAEVVKGINKGKRISNLLALLGYFFAALTSFFSYLFSGKEI